MKKRNFLFVVCLFGLAACASKNASSAKKKSTSNPVTSNSNSGNKTKSGSTYRKTAYGNNFITLKNGGFKADLWKTDTIYNEEGKEILVITYRWSDEQEKYIPSYKQEFGYNDETSDTSFSISYNWNAELNDWVNSYKTVNKYDSNGNSICYERYWFDSTLNKLVGEEKTEYEFDENGREIANIGYSWSTVTDSWSKNRKYQYIRDEVGKVIESRDYSWSTEGSWIITGGSKPVKEVDDRGRPIKEGYMKLLPNGEWELNSMTEYTYDNENYLILKKYESSTSKGKTELVYNTNKNVTSRTTSEWNLCGNKWELTKRYHEELSSDGFYRLSVLDEEYYWDSQNDCLVGIRKEEKEFYDDNKGTRKSVTSYSSWNNNKWNTKTVSNYDTNGSLTSAKQYTWSDTDNDWIESL